MARPEMKPEDLLTTADIEFLIWCLGRLYGLDERPAFIRLHEAKR